MEKKEKRMMSIDGKEYEILFTTEQKETGRKYVAYLDPDAEAKGRAPMVVSAYIQREDAWFRLPTSEAEIQFLLAEILDELFAERILSEVVFPLVDEKDENEGWLS